MSEQLTFPSLSFPGRKTLYVSEVADRLGCTDQHIMDLIEEGKLQAVNIGGATRKFWRIPVEAYELFLRENHSYAEPVPRGTKSSSNGGNGANETLTLL